MPEINLLQTRIHDNTFAWQRQSRLLLTILAVILVLLIGAGIGLILLTHKVNSDLTTQTADNHQIQTQLNQQQQTIGNAKTFQAQLANIKTLLNNHVYLSPVFNELSKMTYVKAQYVTIDVSDNGRIHLEGRVDSYASLGKLILGLNTSKKFSDLKLLSVQPTSGQIFGYVFAIDLTAAQDLFLSAR
jgi:Tfp pilus assembly protein PilN